eukprot:9129438-Karenia_brevis.AAC.1
MMPSKQQCVSSLLKSSASRPACQAKWPPDVPGHYLPCPPLPLACKSNPTESGHDPGHTASYDWEGQFSSYG